MEIFPSRLRKYTIGILPVTNRNSWDTQETVVNKIRNVAQYLYNPKISPVYF